MDMIIESELPASTDAMSQESLTESGFYWREHGELKMLVCRALEDAGFANGFSTRLGGVSPMPENDLNLAGFGEDSDENIYENRRRFLTMFDGDYSLATVWQVHGDNVKLAKTPADAANSEEKSDALASDLPGILAGVKTADCVPVLIGDTKTKAFAAVHAGWRGTAQSIVSKTIARMKEVYSVSPENLFAAIGPAAGCRRYEVGQDVIDAFTENFSTSGKYFDASRDGHALIDLHLANKDQLIDSGVSAESIFTAPFCTIERTELFFSYRVEKKKYGKTGRLLSVIGRK